MDLTTAIVSVIIAVAGSSGISALIQFFVSRNDDSVKRLNAIEEKLDKGEKDAVRTQMLLLLSDYPDDVSEIMKCAEHYFKDLGGNWYMTNLFNKWLTENNIAEPSWFEKDK